MSVGPQTERDVTLRASARRIAGENNHQSNRGGFQSADSNSTMQFRSRIGGATGNRTLSSAGGLPGPFSNKDGGRMSMNQLGSGGVGRIQQAADNPPHGMNNANGWFKAKQTEEVNHLKGVIGALCDKLKTYQSQFGKGDPTLQTREEIAVEKIIESGKAESQQTSEQQKMQQVSSKQLEADLDQGFVRLVDGHTVGPLIKEYEKTISRYQNEMETLRREVRDSREEQRKVIEENSNLVSQLEIKQREYQRLVEETRNHIDVLDQTGAISSQNNENVDQTLLKQQEDLGTGTSLVTPAEWKERTHLLSEENHILFEQVTLLRAHHDQFSKECAAKMDQAKEKIDKFDGVQTALNQVTIERDELIRANSFLETRLNQQAQLLGQAEETRRAQTVEAGKLKEQLSLFQKEYSFYKSLAQKLDTAQTGQLENLNVELRRAHESDKDCRSQVEGLESEVQRLGTQNRQLLADLSRQQREMNQLMAINEEFQSQSDSFRQREAQFTELALEYRDKLERVKFEREKLALKEE